MFNVPDGFFEGKRKRTRQSSHARPPTYVAGTSKRVRRPPATGRITSAGRSNQLPPVVAFVNTEGCTSGHSGGVSVGTGDTTEPIREVITSDMAEVAGHQASAISYTWTCPIVAGTALAAWSIYDVLLALIFVVTLDYVILIQRASSSEVVWGC
nr:hypothetical protein [Tanacetum cinerariifolium]